MWIYYLKNKINNKYYIGQTIQSDPKHRIHEHFCVKKDLNTCIKKAIRKYGRENFEYNFIYQAKTQEELNKKEIEFIELYNSLSPGGYNIEPGGNNGTEKFTLEIRQKISAALKGRKFSKEHCEALSKVRKGFTSENRKRGHIKAMETMKQAGKFIKLKAIHIESGVEYLFDSIEECARSLNLNPSNISRTCRGMQNRTQHKGYRFVAI